MLPERPAIRPRQGVRRLAGDVLTAGTREAQRQADERTPGEAGGHLLAVVVVLDPRVRERALGQGDGELDRLRPDPRLDADVPAFRVHERHARGGVLGADRVAYEPAAALAVVEVVRGGGERVRPQGREVLIRERHARQRVVRGVAPPFVGAEDGRDPPGLDVEGAARPRPQAKIQGVGPGRVEVVGAHLAHEGDVRPRFHLGVQVQPEEPQVAALVVRVVEVGAVRTGEGAARLAPQAEPSPGERERLSGQSWGGRQPGKERGREAAQPPGALPRGHGREYKPHASERNGLRWIQGTGRRRPVSHPLRRSTEVAMATGEMSLRSAELLPGNAPDRVLVERCRQGDPQAFARLVALHEGMVFNLAARLIGDAEEAKDVAQDVFLQVYRTLGRFEGRSSLKTWIYRIVVNQCHNRHRWWRRRRKDSCCPIEDLTPAQEARLPAAALGDNPYEQARRGEQARL